jgi:hypothetical protein
MRNTITSNTPPAREVPIKALATFLLAITACAPAVPTVDDLVGCYEVEVGAWDKLLHPADEMMAKMPSRIQMTTEIGWNGKPKVKAAPGFPTPVSHTGIAYYYLAGEAVEVHWAWGKDVGLHLRLTGSRKELSGNVEVALDGRPPPWKSAPVTLRRVECSDTASTMASALEQAIDLCNQYLLPNSMARYEGFDLNQNVALLRAERVAVAAVFHNPAGIEFLKEHLAGTTDDIAVTCIREMLAEAEDAPGQPE